MSLLRTSQVLRVHRRTSVFDRPIRLWASIRYFDGLTIDEYILLKQMTRTQSKVTRVEQRQSMELFRKAEQYNMQKAKTIMAKPRNQRMLENMEKDATQDKLAFKGTNKNVKEQQQFDNLSVMRNLALYAKGQTAQVKYNGIGPPDKNIYYTQYLGRGVNVYLFCIMFILTSAVFFGFQMVNTYERFYLGAQHNLLRKTLAEFESCDIFEKFTYEVNIETMPNVKSSILKKFNQDTAWEFTRENNYGQVNFQIRLDARPDFVAEGSKPAQYMATISSMGHVNERSRDLIGKMIDRRLDQVDNYNKTTEALSYLMLNTMSFYLFYEMISTFMIMRRQQNRFLTGRSVSFSTIILRAPKVILGTLLASTIVEKSHYLFNSKASLTDDYGYPLINHDEVLEGKEYPSLDPFSLQRWIMMAGVRMWGLDDVKYQTMTRSSEWIIDGLRIHIQSDPPREAWIIKPDHFDEDTVIE